MKKYNLCNWQTCQMKYRRTRYLIPKYYWSLFTLNLILQLSKAENCNVGTFYLYFFLIATTLIVTDGLCLLIVGNVALFEHEVRDHKSQTPYRVTDLRSSPPVEAGCGHGSQATTQSPQWPIHPHHYALLAGLTIVWNHCRQAGGVTNMALLA